MQELSVTATGRGDVKFIPSPDMDYQDQDQVAAASALMASARSLASLGGGAEQPRVRLRLPNVDSLKGGRHDDQDLSPVEEPPTSAA